MNTWHLHSEFIFYWLVCVAALVCLYDYKLQRQKEQSDRPSQTERCLQPFYFINILILFCLIWQVSVPASVGDSDCVYVNTWKMSESSLTSVFVSSNICSFRKKKINYNSQGICPSSSSREVFYLTFHILSCSRQELQFIFISVRHTSLSLWIGEKGIAYANVVMMTYCIKSYRKKRWKNWTKCEKM